jgi:hypothetical protein
LLKVIKSLEEIFINGEIIFEINKKPSRKERV